MRALRAQLLATEHWSLLASRSSTQSEMLTRITIFLALVSAGLVSLALIGQATRFEREFAGYSVIVLVIVALVGIVTQIRVLVVANEDLMYVLAMNRLRAAYLELDPGLAPYFMASAHDDVPGSRRTYDFFGHRRSIIHVGGSSMVLIVMVNSAILGLLAASIARALGAADALAVAVAVAVAVLFFVANAVGMDRSYQRVWKAYAPVFPSEKS